MANNDQNNQNDKNNLQNQPQSGQQAGQLSYLLLQLLVGQPVLSENSREQIKVNCLSHNYLKKKKETNNLVTRSL